MASSPGSFTSGAQPFLFDNRYSRDMSLISQQAEIVNTKNRTVNSVRRKQTIKTSEVSGLRVQNDIEATTRVTNSTGKKGTSKGGAVTVMPRLTTIQDMYPRESAGSGMPFSQAKPAQAQEQPLVNFAHKVLPVAVKREPTMTTGTIPDLDNVKGVIATQPTMRTSTPPLQRADIGTSFAPLQNWKTIVPVVLIFMVAMIFGKKVS